MAGVLVLLSSFTLPYHLTAGIYMNLYAYHCKFTYIPIIICIIYNHLVYCIIKVHICAKRIQITVAGEGLLNSHM